MAAEDVIINFVSGDTSGLKPAEDALDGLNEKDKALAQQARDTAAAYAQRNKQITDGSVVVIRGIEDLISSSKNLDKSIVGGAYTKYLKDIQSQLQLTNVEVLRYLNTVKATAQAKLITATDAKEIDGYKQTISLTNNQIALFSQAQKAARIEGSTFGMQLRAMKNELLSMTEAGQTGTAEFEALKNKYVEVQKVAKQFGTMNTGLVQENAMLAGTIGLARGVVAGYGMAQGATLLFGGANQDLQVAMQKVFGVMQLLNGLQEITALLHKESAASILFETIARKLKTTAVIENTVAEQANVVVAGEQIVAQEGVAVADAEVAVAAEAAAVGTGSLVVANTALIPAVEGATAAQTGLNLAFLANPVFLTLAVIAELIGLYKIFFTDLGHGLEAQKELNYEFDLTTKRLNDNVAAIAKSKDITVANLKSQGASAELIRDAETFNIKEQLLEVQKVEIGKREEYNKTMDILRAVKDGRLKLDADEITEYEKYRDSYNGITQTIIDLSYQLAIKSKNDATQANADNFKDFQATQQARVASTIAGSDKERSVQISVIRNIATEREKSAEFIALSEAEKGLQRANDEKQIQGLQQANYQHYLKGRTDAVDAQIAIVKAHQATSDADAINSINKITDLQIAALKRQRTEALANPNLNTGERQKIIDDAVLAELEVEKKKQIEILNIQKQSINDHLAAVQKGSLDESVYKLLLIENERLAEVAAAGKNVDLITAIDAKYRKQREDADRSYRETLLQNAISRDNAELDAFGLTEKQKLALTIERLNDQQQLEISQANKNGDKIKEINAKFNKERNAAEITSLQAEQALKLQLLDLYGQKALLANEEILNNQYSSESEKLIAANQIQMAAQDKIDQEYANLEKERKAKGWDLNNAEYLVKLKTLKNQEDAILLTHAKTELQIFKDTQQKKLDLIHATFAIIQNGIDQLDTSALTVGLTAVLSATTRIGEAIAANALAKKVATTQDQKDAANAIMWETIKMEATVAAQATINQAFADATTTRQTELAATIQGLEDQKNKELSTANLTKQQLADINKKYADQESRAKTKAYEEDKKAKIAQALINGALAITNIFATVPKFDFGVSTFLLAGIAAATTLLEVGIIKSQPTPKFRHGEIDIQGPGTTTSDSIAARISKGESVIAAEPTAKWRDALEAINNDNFEHYLKYKFTYPEIPEFVQPNVTGGQAIDYEKLSDAIATKMKGIIPGSKSMYVNIDKDGIYTIVVDGNSRTEYKNKRYSFR